MMSRIPRLLLLLLTLLFGSALMTPDPPSAVSRSCSTDEEHKEQSEVVTNAGDSKGDTTSCQQQHDGLCFIENAEKMFDAVVQATPWFVRKITRGKLTRALKKRNNAGKISEQIMYAAVEEVTPKLYLADTLQIMDQYKTA